MYCSYSAGSDPDDGVTCAVFSDIDYLSSTNYFTQFDIFNTDPSEMKGFCCCQAQTQQPCGLSPLCAATRHQTSTFNPLGSFIICRTLCETLLAER